MESRALVLEGEGRLSERTIQLPELNPTDVRIAVDHNGICGTDVHMYEGKMDLDFPVLPGHEFSGIVDELGEDVETDSKGEPVAPGDGVAVVPGYSCGECWHCRNLPSRPLACENRVIYGFRNVEEPPHAHGGMSEYVILEGTSDFYRIPDDMDVSLGALAAPLSTGTHALERGFQPGIPYAREGFGLGKSVVVQGTGPVGLMTVTAAKAAGAGQIVALDVVEERLDLAAEFGATDLVDVTEFDGDADLVDRVRDLTNGGVGPDLVVNATGVSETIPVSLDLPRNAGTYVEVGHYHYGSAVIDPGTIVRKELDVYGSLAYPSTQFETSIAILDDLREEVPFENLFDVQAGFSDAERAYRKMADGEAVVATIHP